MGNKRKKIWIGSALLIVLPFLLTYRLPVFEVAGEHTSLFIKDDQFVLGWIHSIEKEEWFESYQRKNGKIVLTETSFKTFGAGTPYQAKQTTTEHGFITMQLHIDFEQLHVTVSNNVQTTLFLNKRQIPLYQYFDQYQNVIIKTRHVAIWEYIKGDFL